MPTNISQSNNNVGLKYYSFYPLLCVAPVSKGCGSVKVSPVILPLQHVWKASLPVQGAAASPPSGRVTMRTTVATVQMRSAWVPVLQMSFNVAALRGGFQFFWKRPLLKESNKNVSP